MPFWKHAAAREGSGIFCRVGLKRAAHEILLAALSWLLVWCAVAEADPTATSGLLAEGTRWETPFYVSNSGVDGPTLLVVGGVHGNEPAGSRAAEQIRHWPVLKGRLVVVPKANVAGLAAKTRFLPGEPEDRRDLNRNFPGDRREDGARGRPAQALWQFVEEQQPDWVLDLHEGYEFHVSHQPPKSKEKSVGSSVIYLKDPCLDPIARRMQEAANGLVSDPARRFVLLDRGPKKTSLVSACTRHLGVRGMILETTFSRQPVSLRTRQHRAMVNVLMRHLGMIDRDCVDVLTPSRPCETTLVALYDGPGTSAGSVGRLTGIVDRAPGMVSNHLGPADMRPAVLKRFDVIVFPGGSGSKQARAIGPEGRKHVRSFVRQGGGYLGICAGAYLCSAHYSWSLDLIDTAVFTGWREIEGVGRKSMWYRGGSAVVKMQLTDEGKKLFPDVPERVEVKYQNGPIVSPKQDPELSPYRVLAYFRSENALYEPQRGTMIDTPAIVAGRFQRGRVISISPHPEAVPGLHSIITRSIRWLAGPSPPASYEHCGGPCFVVEWKYGRAARHTDRAVGSAVAAPLPPSGRVGRAARGYGALERSLAPVQRQLSLCAGASSARAVVGPD